MNMYTSDKIASLQSIWRLEKLDGPGIDRLMKDNHKVSLKKK